MAPVDDPPQTAQELTADGVQARWSLRLLGAVEASSATQTLTRWPSRAVAALLARLALAPERAHPREELVELLWPGVALDVGRNRLRQVLSTLKSLLEPPGAISAPVLLADRLTVRVLRGAVACDAWQFQSLLRHGQHEAARALYRGELMPGYFDDWVVEARHQLSALFDRLGPAPERVNAPVLPSAAAPPLPTAAAAQASLAVPTGLPSFWTRTFGVELPASRLSAVLQVQRLVTVHGPGGSGKTRLAAEVAQALRNAPDWQIDSDTRPFMRVIFVSLLACVDVASVLNTVCQALRADGREGEPRARIVAALSGWRTLLVLDNLEQIAGGIGAEVEQWLAALPALHVLATSRVLLGIDGEVAFELEGLPLPSPEASLAEAAANPAVALFVDRARAVRADFGLGQRNVLAIAALVQLVAGMPLAIELAASRVRGLSPQELLQHLREDAGTPMLDLLARGAQRASAQGRHASMRHVMAWSWQQLTPALVMMMQTLSVCVAPLRSDAAAAMAQIEPTAAQLLLDELCSASLLRAGEGPDGSTRFAMLQPVREFAAETCSVTAARSARGCLRVWLVGYCADLAKLGPWPVAPELPHVFFAITTAQADGAHDDAMRLAMALRPYWDGNGMPMSVLLALEAAVAAAVSTAVRTADEASADRDLRAAVLELLSQCRARAGFSMQALQHAELGLAMAQGDRRRSLALTRWAVAHYMSNRQDFDFDGTLNEAVALAERANDLDAMARAVRAQYAVLGVLKMNYGEAARLASLNQAQWEQLGNSTQAQAAQMSRLVFWTELGRSEEALAGALQCEQLHLASGEWTMLATATWAQGIAAVKLRRWPEAVAAFRRSIHVAQQHQFAQAIALSLLRLPEALMFVGATEVAARLHGFALAYWASLFQKLTPAEQRNSVRTRRLLRLRLGGERTASLMNQGQGMTLADALVVATH